MRLVQQRVTRGARQFAVVSFILNPRAARIKPLQ
jgi:hypothetical protein